MDFPINGKAEGQILIPWKYKEYLSLTVQDTSGTLIRTHGVAVRRLEKLCKIQNTDVLFMGGIESVIGKIFTTDPVKGEAQLC